MASCVDSGSVNGVLHPISHGIHSLVQPLTAAQCLLEFTLYKGGSTTDYRAAIEKALLELRRISDSITFVRELIRIQQDGTDVITFPLKPAVTNVLSEFQPVLDEAGIHVFISDSNTDPTVTMSPMRLRQALFYQLQAAQLLCASGTMLRITMSSFDDFAELRIDRPAELNSHPARESGLEKAVSDQVAQALHLAEAIVKKAGGEFQFQNSPFELLLRLPSNADFRNDSVRSLSLPAES